MQGFSFNPGLHFRWRNSEFNVRKILNNTDVEVTNLSYDVVEVYSLNELLEAWDTEALVVKRNFKVEKAEVSVHDAELLRHEDMEIINNRYHILEPIIMGEVKPQQYEEYINALTYPYKDMITSVATLYRWLRRWYETHDKRSLLPRHDLKGVKSFKVSTEVQEIIERLLVKYDRQGLDVSNRRIHIEMVDEVKVINSSRSDVCQLSPCGKATTNRIIQHLRNTYIKDKARYGVVQANLNKFGSTTEVYIERPLQRVEMDSTPLDLFLVDTYTSEKERFHLIHAVDKATGYGLGYELWLGEPNARAIKQCLLHAMLPKHHIRSLYPRLQHDWTAYGKPEVIVVDNAKVHDAEDLEEFFGLIGIEVQFCPVKSGHHKGSIERMFRTLNEKVFHSIPGTTFSNPQMRALYDSKGKACLTLKALHEIIHISIVDLIANDYSTSRGGTPAFLWEQGLKDWNVHRTLPMQKKDLVMLLSTGIQYRKITNKGLEISGQHFQSVALMKLFDAKNRKRLESKVRVRFNPSDMRVIYVLDETTKQYIEAYPVKNSLRKKNIDITHPVHIAQLNFHNHQRNKEYNEFDTTHLAYAYKHIEEVVHNSKRELEQLEKLPDDLRAIEHYRHISSIQLLHEAQLAPEGLETLKIIGETERGVNKTTKSIRQTKRNGSKVNDTSQTSVSSNSIVCNPVDSALTPLLFDEDLDELWGVND